MWCYFLKTDEGTIFLLSVLSAPTNILNFLEEHGDNIKIYLIW